MQVSLGIEYPGHCLALLALLVHTHTLPADTPGTHTHTHQYTPAHTHTPIHTHTHTHTHTLTLTHTYILPAGTSGVYTLYLDTHTTSVHINPPKYHVTILDKRVIKP